MSLHDEWFESKEAMINEFLKRMSVVREKSGNTDRTAIQISAEADAIIWQELAAIRRELKKKL